MNKKTRNSLTILIVWAIIMFVTCPAFHHTWERMMLRVPTGYRVASDCWALDEANRAIAKFKGRGYDALITSAQTGSFIVCVESRYTVQMEISDNSK
jgi:hypothetical protein